MYLSKLFNLARKYPDLTENNLYSIDNFLGRTGKNNLFTQSQFKSVLTQKTYFEEILTWLDENQIIAPYEVECSQCHKSVHIDNLNCPYCQNVLSKDCSLVSEYKIIGDISESLAEIEERKNKPLKLYKSCFELLLKRLEKKYEKKENSFIIFTDIKASTPLKKVNPIYHDKICRGAVYFFKELSVPYLTQSKGIYIKSEGDASYIILDSIEVVNKFLNDLLEKIYSTEFYQLMEKINSEKKIYKDDEGNDAVLFIFLKIYIADSETGKYSQKDVLSIDFDAMEAFTFIKRIEKKAKSQILENQNENQLSENFPICIFARQNWFNSQDIVLKNVDDYGDVSIYYSNYLNIKNYFDKNE